MAMAKSTQTREYRHHPNIFLLFILPTLVAKDVGMMSVNSKAALLSVTFGTAVATSFRSNFFVSVSCLSACVYTSVAHV